MSGPPASSTSTLTRRVLAQPARHDAARGARPDDDVVEAPRLRAEAAGSDRQREGRRDVQRDGQGPWGQRASCGERLTRGRASCGIKAGTPSSTIEEAVSMRRTRRRCEPQRQLRRSRQGRSRRARRSTPGCARSWPGTSTRRPARPSGSTSRETRGLGPAPRGPGLRRPRPLRLLPGRVAARRAGAPLGAARATRTGRSRSSRPAARPACRSRASTSTTSASTTSCSATRCPTSSSRRAPTGCRSGPPGPRRLRLAVEHLCQHRGGICFMVDLDPRWVIKLIKARRDGGDGALQAARHRPGPDPPARPTTTSAACSPRRSCSRPSARRPRSRSSASPASSAAARR